MMPRVLTSSRRWLLLAFVLSAPAAQAVLITSWMVNQPIADGNASGLVSAQSVTADFDRIGRLSVTLEVDGGWMGDLFAYVVHDTGYSVLLNRPGRTSTTPFGSAASGLEFTFDDLATLDAHSTPTGTGSLSGVRQPDARETDPGRVLPTDARTAYLSNFNGLDPNGQWTLFIADLAAGDQATLVRWGLEIEPARINPVPDATAPLPVLAASLVGLALAHCRRDRRKNSWISRPG